MITAESINIVHSIAKLKKIANSCIYPFIGSIILIHRPVNQPMNLQDYWVSLLHKMLVGREVLDTKISAGNRTHVHFYSHCTRPSSRYEPGSLTVFGINLAPTKVTASVKGVKPTTVHKYVLLPGYDAPNRMFAE